MKNRFDKLEMSSSKFERKTANPRLQSKSQVEDTARVTAQQFERVIQNTKPTEEVRFERVMQKPTPVETLKPKLDISEFPKFKKEPIEREFNTSLEEELNFIFSQSSVDPASLFDDGYELQDQAIIPNENLDGTFIPEENQIEFFVYDIDKNLLFSDYKFEDWNITTNTSTKTLKSTDTIQLYPAKNLYDRGYDMGNLYALYNFINLELNSSNSNPYYLSDISSDRTEIRIKSNFISNEEIEASFNILKTKIDSKDYFDEFYISFGDNEYHIGVNIEIETENNQDSILIKLYDGLPEQYKVKDELYVATKVAETQAFKVEFEEILPASFDDVQYLQGPNTNLDLKDIVNNSTELKSQDDIKNTSSSESRFNLSSILNQKGVKITPNYSYDTFDEFVKFSSAKKRIENFYYKVQQIESYQSDLATLDSLTTYNTVTADKNTINNNIENIIKNFDGYEYYLYYNDSDSAYPKSGSQYPYPLLNSTSSEVLNWLGSDVEGSTYYGGILLSASLYDNKNQDWLLYTIPEFIRNNNDNDNYVDFANMTGQHFDELWLYTKAVTEKSNTTNTLDEGIPLKLAEEGIKSLGFKGVGNNFNNQDGYIGLTGEDNGTYLPPTGSETITNYIAINEGNIENYFIDDYVEDGYSETIGDLGFPYAIDRVSKEIYKRLYHNMAYLVKKKGTISGLRQLINIWGIPSTILRINEFGGKDKDHSDDYDLWFKRYSYAYKPNSNRNVASSSVLFPWMPLERNRIADGEYIVPDNLQFRFKTTGYPSSSFAGGFFTQSLAVKKSDGDDSSTEFDFGIGLFYEEPTTGSYLGADTSEYADWGRMRFYISGAAADGGTAISDDIYLPFFDKGWWSVMLQRNQHVSASDNSNATTYTLYAKNKIYNGADGDIIGFEGSASIISNISTSINEAWNKFGTGSADGIYLGGFVEGADVGGITLNEQGKIFSGSLQEFRYYSNDIPEATFNDFVMNPRSIEGNSITGDESSFDIVNFRAPLGNELEAIFTSSISAAHTDIFPSVHPAASGKASNVITGSFVNPATNATSSDYSLIYYGNNTAKNFSEAIRETYFLDQPAVGIRNRISNKIQVRDSQSYGTVLSSQRSLEQEYEINEDFTENINSLEVAFSPQDDINDDIIDSFGYGVIADALADPRNISQSLDYYSELRETAEDYFQKYTKGNIYDYIRLIKYIDNSLFKAIKNYVPARTSVSTGIIIKQHMLERNRYRQPVIDQDTIIAYTNSGSYNTPLYLRNLEITGGLEIDPIDGGTGGSVEKFNYSGSPEFGQTSITQSYNNTFDTVAGLQTIVEDTQKEFYDGEYSGSKVEVTDGELFDNPYKSSIGNNLNNINLPYGDFSLIDSNIGIGLPTIYANLITISDKVSPSGIFGLTPSNTLKNISDSVVKIKFQIKYKTTLAGGKFRLSSSLEASPLIDKNISSGLSDFITSNFDFKPGEEYTFEIGDGNYQITNLSIDIIDFPSIQFDNSDYNALLNNYNDNRDNSFLYDVDYSTDATNPINKDAILDGSADKAQVPDSNYTSRRITYPRYEGSRVSSANYNFYTPSGSVFPISTTSTSSGVLDTFLNGDTGSWEGDESFGNAAVVEKNPIYIAHFNNSIENKGLEGTYTFNIDYLLEIPSTDIKGTDYKPKPIKISGDNDKLYEVVSTFEKNRDALVSYEKFNIIGNELIDSYNSLKAEPKKIYQGGHSLELNCGNQINQIDSYSTCSFITSSWCYLLDDSLDFTNFVLSGDQFLTTGSNTLTLSGSNNYISSSYNANASNTKASTIGPGLGLIHSVNIATLKQQRVDWVGGDDDAYFGIPKNLEVDPNLKENYFRFQFTSSISDLTNYEVFDEPFLIEPGFLINISWYSGGAIPKLLTQTFEVLRITNYSGGGTNPNYICSFSTPTDEDATEAESSTIWDVLQVQPNPEDFNIPEGKIENFSIIKRKDQDKKVIIYQSPPNNTVNGAKTPSGPGYIIPNDMNLVQKNNVQSIINDIPQLPPNIPNT